MIWAEETIKDDIIIVGEYSNNKVSIYLQKEDKKHMLFEKIISGLAYEEPTKSEIKNKFDKKFYAQLNKASNNHDIYFQTIAFND